MNSRHLDRGAWHERSSSRLPALPVLTCAVLLSVCVALLSAPTQGWAKPPSHSIVTIRATGLPAGQAADIVLERGHATVLRLRGNVTLTLPAGRYRLLVLRARISRATGGVRSGATALPMRSTVPFKVSRGHRTQVVADYGTIINPGVRKLPNDVTGVVGNPDNPTGLLLPHGRDDLRPGTTLTSGPTPLLPVGLVARVDSIRRKGAEDLLSLTSVPVTTAIPAIVTSAPIDLGAVASSAGKTAGAGGLGVKAEVNIAGPCGLTGEEDITPIVSLKDVRFSSDIRLEPWGGGPKVDFTISAQQEVGFRLDTSAGVQCSVPLLDPTLVGVVPVGPVPVPVYLSIPISVTVGLGEATQLQATTSWEATYGMRTHAKFLVPIPSPVFEVHKVSSKISATSGPQFTLEPNISVEPGLGVPDVGNLHMDAGTGVQFALEPGVCKWDWRIGTFSATADLGPVKLGTPDFTATTVPLWEDCHGAGAVSPPAPAPAPAPPAPQPSTSDTEAVVFPGSPLTVSVGPLGQCQSSYAGSEANYFPPENNLGDCGFFLSFPDGGAGQPSALKNTTWGFDGLAGPKGIEQYVPVSDTPVTGSGTANDPYTETTIFKVVDFEGNQDALVTETTTYVNGASQFTSSYKVKNTTGAPIYFRSIYAGDLYVGGNDYGAGVFESGSPRFVGGQNVETGAVGGFQEAAAPALPWSSFGEGCWNDVEEEFEARCAGAGSLDYGIWHELETTAEESQTFNESIEPTNLDNATGVEWDQMRTTGLPPGGEQAFTIINAYRP